MLISVICPVFNEEQNIQNLIDFFYASQPAEKELHLIDGGSTDRTVEIIEKNIGQKANLHLLHNPKRIVPFALNLGIANCKADIIVRLDGHSEYEPDYFIQVLEAFKKSGADIVGGPTRTRFKSPRQEVIAFVMSHRFGIGGSKVHNETFEGLTDSVTFGAWKRRVFEKIGLFDERLKRNQDDEFHYRANAAGLKVYQFPPIKLYYFPRSNFRGLMKQYFQYGFYKPLVLMKINSGLRLRHIVPSCLVVYLISLPFFMVWIGPLTLIPLALYIVLAAGISLTAPLSTWSCRLLAVYGFIALHISYGLGFLFGIPKSLRHD